jgi:acetolactate synthase-1/2/3 large subunit
MIKVSDYVVEFLKKNEVSTVFMLTGGFAMHLNDSFSKNKDVEIVCCHQELCCAYGALGYFKASKKIACVNTTAGCGATNAITGVLSAWQDSTPMIIISGQVNGFETIRYTRQTKGLDLRNIQGADCDIIRMVEGITKYAREIYYKEDIVKTMKDAFIQMKTGRPGPVWLSIPLNIQGSLIEINELDYVIEYPTQFQSSNLNFNFDLSKYKRPLILLGQGVRLSNAEKECLDFINNNKIPFVTTFLSIDIIDNSNPYYQGRIGVLGERCGNFTIQNCDLLIILGSRLSNTIVGYNTKTFSRESYKVVVDIDKFEHEKNNINIDYFYNCDLKYFFENEKIKIDNNHDEWLDKCKHWKNTFYSENPYNYLDEQYGINPYLLFEKINNILPDNSILINSAGSVVTALWHKINLNNGKMFLNSSSQGDMGSELPMSIGAWFSKKNNSIFCVVGDGSFNFNIQELSTIKQYNIPIQMLVCNNNGYQAIRSSQEAYFNKNYIGCDPDSGVYIPDYEKMAKVFEFKYVRITNSNEIDLINKFTNQPVIFDIKISNQERCPKLGVEKLNDGTFKSLPFEDMLPRLDRNIFKNNMFITPLD